MRWSQVHRMNALGQEHDWRTDPELMRWCWKGGGRVEQSQPSTSTQVTEPWAAQKPYLTRGFQEAQSQFESDRPAYFPGDTVVGFNPLQQQAQGQMAQRAQMGNPLIPAAQGQAMDTLQGNYLNPDISGVAQSIDAQLRPRIGAQFAGAGRNLSPAHAGTYAEGFTNAIAPFAFNANQNERNRMMAATAGAPGLANQDYFDAAQLGEVGALQQGMEQQELQAEIDRHNFEQTVEQNKLREYMANITGQYGGTRDTTATQPVYDNPSRS